MAVVGVGVDVVDVAGRHRPQDEPGGAQRGDELVGQHRRTER